MRIYVLKTWERFYYALESGEKTFEVRDVSDWLFVAKKGEVFCLVETVEEDGLPTGRCSLWHITHVCTKEPFLPSGLAVFGIRPVLGGDS